MKRIKIFLLILLAVFCVYFIDYNISENDINFFQGKDGGFFVRFESIVILSSILFLFMSSNHRLLKMILGLVIGVISSVVSYFIWFNFLDDNGLSFHIIALSIVFVTYFIVDYMGNKFKR